MNDITQQPQVMYRTVIERSSMTNNDEAVCYKSSPITYKDVPVHVGHLVFCRPVLQTEIDAGLDLSFKGSSWDEKVSDITRLLDAYYRICQTGEFWITVWKDAKVQPSLSKFLSHEMANQYYDCMSGGCPTWILSILVFLAQDPSVDKDTPVYPGKTDSTGDGGIDDLSGWYTIADFLEDAKGHNVPDFGEIFTKYHLPAMKLLPASIEDTK